jgi:hypothetical protein
MTKLIWDAIDTRRYESGVDRGVLYPMSGGGFVWNGLISVAEAYDGGDLSTYAADGTSFLAKVSTKTYQATVNAFSAPREFDPCVGDLEIKPGFILTRQTRQLFNFSYRTMIGDDLAHKLHVVYNVLATPTSRSLASTNNTAQPLNLEWKFTATPVNYSGFKPTAHFIIDTTNISAYNLAILENTLYGNTDDDPFLPTPESLLEFLHAVDPGPYLDQILEPISDIFGLSSSYGTISDELIEPLGGSI